MNEKPEFRALVYSRSKNSNGVRGTKENEPKYSEKAVLMTPTQRDRDKMRPGKGAQGNALRVESARAQFNRTKCPHGG